MSEKSWLGSIFLKDEGGYKIILKSLEHYKKRLRTICKSPELQGSAAMFGPLLHQEASKSIPKIEELKEKIIQGLVDPIILNSLRDNIDFFLKALNCYESDITKAKNSKHEYFQGLVGNLSIVEKDLLEIKTATLRINQISK